jgi:putative oxidoreductase
MTTFTANPAGTSVRRSRRTRAAGIGLWTVRILLAAQFTIGGVLKLTAEASMVTMFHRIGAGQGLRLFVGICELAGAIGLLVPRLAWVAAAALVLLMIGAAVTNVLALHISPALPLVLGALAALVAVAITRKENAR